MIDLTHSVSLALDCFCLLLLLSSWLIHVRMTMRLCNSWIPEEHFVCYQTSQHNWVIIKVLYRCLRRYMLGWRISRLGFVTPIVGEVSLGPLGNAHHSSLASIATNKLVAGWCITERAQRYLSDNRSDKSKSRSMPTQQVPSETPVEHLYNHPITLWHLVAHKVFLWYTGVT